MRSGGRATGGGVGAVWRSIGQGSVQGADKLCQFGACVLEAGFGEDAEDIPGRCLGIDEANLGPDPGGCICGLRAACGEKVL